jgi:hypothetical protein
VSIFPIVAWHRSGGVMSSAELRRVVVLAFVTASSGDVVAVIADADPRPDVLRPPGQLTTVDVDELVVDLLGIDPGDS